MAFVKSYEYDVFVSYAHVDNGDVAEGETGWIDALMRVLQSQLNMLLGRPDMAVYWRDAKSLRGNQGVSAYIDDQVRRAALFLMVLSHGYLASPSCMAELAAFLERGQPDRIFVIWKDPIDQQRYQVPPEVLDRRKFKFHVLDDATERPRVLGWPLPQPSWAEDRQRFYPMVKDLAVDLDRALTELSRSAAAPAFPAAPSPARVGPERNSPERNSPERNSPERNSPERNSPGRSSPERDAPARRGAVLLAQVTDDLDPRREEMRRYLDQAGIDVLPTGDYRLARAEFQPAFEADLAKSAAFVQLLGPFAGKAPPDVPEGFGRFQLELARARNTRVLQWRSPDLDLAAIAAPAHRELAQGAEVEAMPFEEFKREVAALFDAPAAPPAPARRSFLFVNAADVDQDEAEDLAGALGGDVDWHMPLYDPGEPADAVDKEIAEQLVTSEALVFYYGGVKASWVLAQLRQFEKLSHERASPPRLLALVEGPPAPKAKLRIGLKGLKVFTRAEAPEQIRLALGA